MTITDACKVLNVSRQTMMNWLKRGRFPNALKQEGETNPWLIPVEDVEAVRIEEIADLERRIRAISKPASTYQITYAAHVG